MITGAARGIGRATAVAFAREGADVVGIDICAVVDPRSGVTPSTPEDLEETGKLVAGAGRRWFGMKVDTARPAGDARGSSESRAGIRRCRYPVRQCGHPEFHPLLEMEDADWNITIDINVTGTANTLRAFAPYIVKRGGGRIILTSSTQGEHGTLYASAYSASKWAIIGLMKSAALELGRHKITVNALIPGLIDTPLTRHEERYAQAIQVAGGTPTGVLAADEETARKGLARHSPLGVPWIDPANVAPVVVFLASDAACMVSGATFAATAGDSANITA